MLATLLIVFREVIEVGLVVGIVLAATRGVPGRGRWLAGGVAGGVIGACLVALFAGEIGGLFAGTGQEFFNAGILLVAVAMLTWHNAWMAVHGREIAQRMRNVGEAVMQGGQSLAALAIVVGVAVLREGVEVVLFLYGIAAGGGSSVAGMLSGGALGIAGGAAMAMLMYLGLLRIPMRHLFAVTTAMITLLAAGMAAQAMLLIQQAGYLTTHGLAVPLWNSSGLLAEHGIPGSLLHTLVGYTDSPDLLQLLAYVLVIGVNAMMMRRVSRRQQRAATVIDAG